MLATQGGARWRFVATICLGSFLLFLVQPMIARMALPRLGGAPAVWNSAMLVYQGLLLAGYAYAHWLGRFAPRRQSAIHLILFLAAALTLPIGLSSAVPPPASNPFLWVPWLLLASIGPLFFVISAQAPLIQRWFALSSDRDPYPLYAASNLGSFAGLLAYPLLVEPLLAVQSQRWLWSAGYVLLAGLVAWCASSLPAETQRHGEATPAAPVAARQLGRWALLAAVPSGLILSTTLHLTTDIGAAPLLWVLPLGVYLLSFVVAFADRRGPARAVTAVAPVFLLLAAGSSYFEGELSVLIVGALAILTLFVVSVALHAQLFDQRPEPRQLTAYYLAMSVGGFLGGVFCALLAPLLFDWTYEHLLLLFAAAMLMTGASPFARLTDRWKDKGPTLIIWGGVALMVVILALAILLPMTGVAVEVTLVALIAQFVIGVASIGNRLLFTTAVVAIMICAGGWQRLSWSAEPGRMTRSFFGVYTVRADGPDARALVHGTTLHGIQNRGSPERERMPTTHYAPGTGVGLAMTALPRLYGDQARVSVVGLGAGTLACYARPGQSWTFFEIDPAIVRIAEDPSRFTFLSRCLPQRSIVVGDARLTLDRAPARSANLLVIDAFSSDAIPVHLLTREAFKVYRRHLRPDGLLLVHISNRHLKLDDLVASLAADGGWNARRTVYRPTTEQWAANHTTAVWVALSPSAEMMDRLVERSPDSWEPLAWPLGAPLWTDDHASLLPLIRWN